MRLQRHFVGMLLFIFNRLNHIIHKSYGELFLPMRWVTEKHQLSAPAPAPLSIVDNQCGQPVQKCVFFLCFQTGSVTIWQQGGWKIRGALPPLQTAPAQLWLWLYLFLAVSAGAPGVTLGCGHLHSVGQSAGCHTTRGLQTALNLVAVTRERQHQHQEPGLAFHYREPLISDTLISLLLRITACCAVAVKAW